MCHSEHFEFLDKKDHPTCSSKAVFSNGTNYKVVNYMESPALILQWDTLCIGFDAASQNHNAFNQAPNSTNAKT